MKKILENLNKLTSNELKTTAYAHAKTSARGVDTIHGLGVYSYVISLDLKLEYLEEGDNYAFNIIIPAGITLKKIYDSENKVVKVTLRNRKTIENFFSTKLIFDIKKNF